ncbi:MAG: hypothetical protein QOH14_833, partial [Pseudonocardiales bacterium]|nr:hypothetical protein [Pseudonocardiales bacterium]
SSGWTARVWIATKAPSRTTAATTFAAAHLSNPAVAQLAAVHSYVVAFWWSAGIFVVGAAIVAALLRPGVPDFNANANAGNVVVL